MDLKHLDTEPGRKSLRTAKPKAQWRPQEPRHAVGRARAAYSEKEDKAMQIKGWTLLAVLLTVVLGLVFTTQVAVAAEEIRLDGRVHMIDKDTSTITLLVDQAQRNVVYNSQTQFTFRNKPGSVDDVKAGFRVICLGKQDSQGRLLATRVDAREGKDTRSGK
jgi:hypothetical protein